MMDGRVKTLHSCCMPGCSRSVVETPRIVEVAARVHEVEPVDLVCVNL